MRPTLTTMKKNYLKPTTETAPLFLSAGIMSGTGQKPTTDPGNSVGEPDDIH